MLRRAAVLLAVLTAAAVIIASQLYVAYRAEGIRIGFGPLLMIQLGHWLLWALWGPVAWRLAGRWPLDAAVRRAHLPRHAVAGPLVALAVLVTFLPIYYTLLQSPGVAAVFVTIDRSVAGAMTFLFGAYFHVELLVYGGIVAASQIVRDRRVLADTERRALSLQARLAEARLQVLRAQLQPHFLFNTLHTIGSLVLQREHDRALKTLAELGDLLRAAMAHRHRAVIPLEQELAQLRHYASIEEMRFGDRVAVEWAVQPDALSCAVPAFLLQPVVENAFRHGVARRTGDARVRLGARLEGDSLRLTVFNDGPPLPEGFSLTRSSGFGLANVREQLQAWDPDADMRLENVPGGVETTLAMRARREESGTGV